MELLALVVVIILIAVVAVAAVVHQRRLAEERQRALRVLAERLGLDFFAAEDPDHDDRYARFAVFRQGHSRVAFNTMWGDVDIDGARHAVVMGDFRYRVTTRTGKTSSTVTYRLSYLIVHLPTPAVPDLLIRPEGLFDKLGQAIGFDDIDFEDAAFSRRFVVRSSDRRFAYDVCHPRMIEWLSAHAESFPAIDMEAGQLCLATDKKRWEPTQFEQHLAYAREFLIRWPDHVRRELGLHAPEQTHQR